MTDDQRFPASPQTFRLEEANIKTVLTLARGDNISKSDWYRRAVLAQIVTELAMAEREQVVMRVGREVEAELGLPPMGPPEVPRETPERVVEGVGHRGNRWG